jgi:hypothetical protein
MQKAYSSESNDFRQKTPYAIICKVFSDTATCMGYNLLPGFQATEINKLIVLTPFYFDPEHVYRKISLIFIKFYGASYA